MTLEERAKAIIDDIKNDYIDLVNLYSDNSQGLEVIKLALERELQIRGEEMTPEEALRRVELHDTSYGFWKTVKEAVKKQVQIKAKEIETINNNFVLCECKCGWLITESEKYCPECGQKIKWR